MVITPVEVGMFRLPGVVVFANDSEQPLDEEKIKEMDEWANSEQGTGKRLTDVLWSFKNVSQRDWFILRWS